VVQNNGMVRINSVITGNGKWTVSFEHQIDYPGYALTIDICDLGQITLPANTDNKWKKFSHTVDVTNYGDGSLYNFIDINGLTGQQHRFRNFKVEKGNRATDWTPAPEDIDAAIGTVATQSANALAQAQNAQNTAAALQQVTSFLQTTVDGNVIATGTVAVGDVNEGNAGITGATDNNDPVRFWAGTTYANRYTSPWRIHDSGFMKGNHQIGDKNLAFQWGVDMSGSPVIDFFHHTGFKTFTLDPNRGLIAVNYIPESWNPLRLLSMGQAGALLNEANAIALIKSKLTTQYYYENPGTLEEVMIKSFALPDDTAITAYDYQNGTHPENEQYSSLTGYKNAYGTRTNNIAAGWYAMQFGNLGTYRTPPGWGLTVYYSLYYISGGKVTKTQQITFNI